MRKNKLVVMLAIVVLILASLACSAVTGGGGDSNNTNTSSDTNTNTSTDSNTNDDGFSFSTANITNVYLATDENATNQVTSYAPADQYFYCFFDLNNAPDDTVVKGVWTLVSADGYDSNSEIDSAEVTGSDNTYFFSLNRSTDAWPIGKYKIDLYLNGDLAETVEFEVQ